MTRTYHLYSTLAIALLLAGCQNAATRIAPAATATKPVPEVAYYCANCALLASRESAPLQIYAAVFKYTFDVASGTLQGMSASQEPLDAERTEDTACAVSGSKTNDSAMDFRRTGIFIVGGTLVSVDSPSVGKIAIEQLQPESGAVLFAGSKSDADEFQPCVGATLADSPSYEAAMHLPRDAVISIRVASQSRPIKLTLPAQFSPFTYLRYRAGAVIPVPARLATLSYDIQKQRVVLSYRSVFAKDSAVRKLDLRAVFPASLGGAPGEYESVARFTERSQAILADLDQCPPFLVTGEPCADPNRKPNPGIFAQ